LGGTAPKPDYPDARRNIPIDLPVNATPEELAEAAGLYVNYCHLCHGSVGGGDGPIPDLAYSTIETHNMYKDIVLGGVFLEKGMPNFNGRLTEEQAELIHQHILSSAKRER
jgi:quinohemoprotein ethanol dehydrogenase